MKKFYTLLSAALLATGLLSAASLKTAKFDLAAAASEKLTSAKVCEKQLSPASLKDFQKALKSPSLKLKDPNAPDPSGEYVAILMDEEDSSLATTYCTVAAGEKDGEYIVKNFLAGYVAQQTKDVNAVLTTEIVQGQTFYFLEFAQAAPIADSSTGKTFDLYPYFYYESASTPGGYYFFSDMPVSFLILKDDAGKVYLVEPYGTDENPGGVFFGEYRDTGNPQTTGWYGGSIMLPLPLQAPNAVMTSDEYTDNTNTEPSSYKSLVSVYDNEMLVFGLGGFGAPCMFTVDQATNTVVAKDQVLMSFPKGNQYFPEGADFYATSGDATDYTLTGNVTENEQGNSVIDFGLWLVINDEAGWLAKYDNSVMTLDFNVFTGEAGIANVVADSDVNAPVEYFNLQGVRVANPEAGQLVIKRQGKTVSKVIVR